MRDVMMTLEDLMELLDKDIRSVVDKGDILPGDYDCLSKAVDMVKDIKTVIAMEQGGYFDTEGVSGRMYPPLYWQNSNGYDGGGNSNEYNRNNSMGNSYARGRSAATGRYVSRGDDTMVKLSNMMANTRDDREREIISRIMSEMGR